MEKAYQALSSPLGVLHLYAGKTGLIKIAFDEDPEIETGPPNRYTRQAYVELEGYFLGDIKEFKVPLSIEGTDFQKEVWTHLRGIPYGKTTSYEKLAMLSGGAEKVRAVASANGANPLPIVIPCHRVVGKNGELTGYSGGLWRKEALLEIESGAKQYDLF